MERSAAAIAVDTKTEIKQRDIPRPIGTEALVEIEAAGVCGTDIHLIKKSIPYLQPTVSVPGHEGIGRIIGLGPDVDDEWKIGDG
ncbi:hypothetical protein N7488_000767 [Penicillium malachiteum]|nr:hypothetical protein N7488_000767 [Penicillium malachiteum]